MKKAEKAAQELFDMKFSVEKYQQIQNIRRDRLGTFKKHNIPALVKTEEGLIAWGEEVLKLLKQHYDNDHKKGISEG